MKLSDYVNLYYEYNNTLNDYSLYAYKASFAKNVYPLLHDPQIDTISVEDINNLIVNLEEKLDHNTVWAIFRELRKIFRHAKDSLVIKDNPFDYINYSFETRPLQLLSEEELKMINEAIKHTPLCSLYQMTLACGIKLTELLVLTWHDVSFANKRIYIKKRAALASTPKKTINVQNQLISYAITPEIQKILYKSLSSQFGFDNPYNLVFTSERGKYIPHYIVDQSNKYVKDATGIDDFSFRKLETYYKLTHTE